MKMFAEDLVGFIAPPRIQQGRTGEVAKNLGNFFKYEYLQFTIYCPHLRRVENVASIAATVGEKNQGPFMRGLQCEILGCERFVVPGNHMVCEFNPQGIATGWESKSCQRERWRYFKTTSCRSSQ